MGNFDRYSNKPSNAPFTGVTFGFGSTILEVELNEMQQIQNDKMISLLGIKGDCVIDRDGFSYDGNTLTIGTKIVKDGIMLETIGATLALTNGQSAYISSETVDYTYGDTIKANGNTSGATISNTIMDDRGTNETTRRKGYRFTINTDSGMLLGTVMDKKFVCLAQDYFSGVRRYIGDNVSAPSKVGGVKLNRLYGKSEQKQYTGKNLVDFNSLSKKQGERTINGITFTPVYGDSGILEYISVDGTSNDSSARYTLMNGKFDFLLEDETYMVLTGCPLGGSSDSYYMLFHNNSKVDSNKDKGDGARMRYFNSDSYWISIDVMPNTTVSNKKFYPMIRLETIKDSTYEPYVGAIPSPNPDYPQEIKSVSSPVVMCSGKNLINTEAFESTVNGVTWKLDDNHITASGTPTAESFSDSTVFINNKKSGKYTLSLQGTTTNVVTIIAFVNSNEETVDTLTGNEITFDIADYEYAKCFYVQFNSVENDVEVKCDAYVQLEYGGTKTEYKPYSGYFASLPYDLNAIPVESGGNVTIDGQQYIADYVDFEKKQLVRMVWKIIFDGTEQWSYSDPTSESMRRFGRGFSSVRNIGMCNYLTRVNDIVDTDNSFILQGDWIDVRYLSCNSVDEFKALLSQMYSSGNPLTVYYGLVTPTTTYLTDDEIEAFAQFYSQCPVTNIFAASVDSDQNPILDFEVSTTETGAKSLQNENTCTELMGRVNTVAKEVTSRTKIVVSETEPADKSVVWVQ